MSATCGIRKRLEKILEVGTLTQAISKVPANLRAIDLALDLESREFFFQDLDEFGIGILGGFGLPQRGSVVLGLSPESMRILANVT